MNTGMSHPTVWRMKRRLLIGRKLLVVVDPVSSYLGKTDSHKNSEVRGVLEPLSEMAERTRIAILSVTHFSKAGANNTAKALHRFIGSIAFTGAPRAAFAVIEDAEHDGRRLLLHAKNNLAPPPHGLAFMLEQCHVEGDIVASRILWDNEPVAITANEALAAEAAGTESRSAKAEAAAFLQSVLAGGPVGAAYVNRMARDHGLTPKVIRSAREALGVKIERDGFGPGSKSLWSLPEDASMPQHPILAHNRFGHLWSGRASIKAGTYPPARYWPVTLTSRERL
jgi:putative DNA primase/helicase